MHAKRLLAHPLPKKRAESFSEALNDFIFDCRARLRPSTADRYWYSLKTLDWKKLSDHKPVTEPNLLKALKVFYNWCVEQDRFDRNPYLGKQVVFGVRERVLSDEEIGAIWQYDHQPYSDILKTLILTGQRRNQIWRFEQDWIEGDELTFPSSIMKGKKAHTIPLAGYSSYLYPYSFNSWSKAKVRIDKHVGFSDWVVHDFRRYFSTTMARIGTPLHVTEQIMDHRSTVSGVAAIYNRYSFLPEMKEALEKYEAHVHSIAT